MNEANNNPANDKNSNVQKQVDIEERLQQYANVNIVTSINHLGLTLGYLAQCEYAIGNSDADIGPDSAYGRGYLLEMIGDGIKNFASEFEKTEMLYLKEQNQINSKLQRTESLQTNNATLLSLATKYKQIFEAQNQSVEQGENEQYAKLEQQIKELNKQLAQLH